MASLAIGSLGSPSSRQCSSPVASSSSFAIGSQIASKFLRISKFDKTKNSPLALQQKHINKSIDQSFFEPLPLHKINKDKFKLYATSTNNPQFDATHDLKTPEVSIINFVDALYRLIRPYTAVVTIVSVVAMSLLTVNSLSDFSPLFFIKVVQALIGGIFMQMYVSGFNQICDIELDKVNKQSLPLAAGELSMKTAIVIASLSAIMSLSIGWFVGSPPLLWCLVWWFIVGTAYSANVLPYLRWKRFPFTAAFCAMTSRALVLPIGYYLHMQNSIPGVSALLSRPILFAVAMLSAFSLSAMFFKDIPDIKGDRMHGIKSLAIKLGEKRVYWISISIIEIAYIAAAFIGATSPISWSKYVTIIGHLGMGLLLWVRARSVDPTNTVAVQSMYMFLIKLVYAEYGLISLVR
nr:CBGAS4 [Helichrysum umbraculigerum]